MSAHRFPNESEQYRAARERLLEAEADLRDRVERVAALRRGLPEGGRVPEDYVFEELDERGRTQHVRLSELFAPGKDTLFLYCFMFGPKAASPCPMCSSFLDGLNANAAHLDERINVAVVARSPIERIATFASARGWGRLRLLSSANNTYQRDYLGEDANGDQLPMANVFVKRGGEVSHFWASELYFRKPAVGDPRHIDPMWPLWNVLDLTPAGRGDRWYPALERA